MLTDENYQSIFGSTFSENKHMPLVDSVAQFSEGYVSVLMNE